MAERLKRMPSGDEFPLLSRAAKSKNSSASLEVS
jgi:hypothetical protein